MLRERLTRPRDFDRRATHDGRGVRFTCRLDEESERFERELSARLQETPPRHDDAPSLRELPLTQRHAWLLRATHEHRLLQVRSRNGAPAMQVAVRVERPRLLQLYGHAVAHRIGAAVSDEEESFGLHALRRACHAAGDLLTLRLQPYRTDAVALRNFEARARRAGFSLCNPIDVTRTLLLDLRQPVEALLATLSKKTRAKIKHRTRASVELRAITDPRHIPACRAAVNAAMRRTGAQDSGYDFAAAFSLAAAEPTRARVIGLFLPARPEVLLAYVVGLRHGEVAEYSSAGSLDDPGLRLLHFNYFLLWELSQWAREGGARWLDLGGVTDGGADDPRAGISAFKRHFTNLDVEHGRELLAVLHPGRHLLFDTMRGWKRRASATPAEDD
jgi:hypothetical protein